ncbi:hypothetical protein B0H17DRAFT_1232465 [Mycena rosella]|uniref:Uncharacterized protein n=1 Tax=Mycena rosella TaxID=1033263 RepID=A0AAD7D963_MYCRO|nr:hypothetical protein B0H17DRAFT_1232465 [Mycena rosella]
MYTPQAYVDDTFIVTNIENPFLRRAAFKLLLEHVYEALTDDWEPRLDDLGYRATSSVAADSLIPLLIEAVRQFAADSDALADKRRALTQPKRLTLSNITPRPVSFPALDSTESNESLVPADAAYSPTLSPPAVDIDRPSSKPTPYSDKRILAPIEVPNTRHGPKIKTRGVPALAVSPALVAPAAATTPDPIKRLDVPGDVYTVLELVFSPKLKGQVSFADLRRVMTCRELGFSYERGEGARRRFVPPQGSVGFDG